MQTPYANDDVAAVFEQFDHRIRPGLLALRELVLSVAEQYANNRSEIANVEETLKWGQPSYLTQTGSTLRLGGVTGKADYYALYFHCQTKLIPTFKELFPDLFTFSGNRAIIFHHDDEIPQTELRDCITAALSYHSVKHLPHLGI